MNENKEMAEMEKLFKEVKITGEKLKKYFNELQDSLQKIYACECEDPILTEKEHNYLFSIIKPFRDRVTYIGMFAEGDYKSFIEIGIDGDLEIALPSFAKNKMYLGMKEDRKYVLKELGL